MACFGTGGANARNHRLVSNTPRLPLKAIPKFDGTATLRWQGVAAAPLTRVARTAEGIVIETAETSVRVATREWLMPMGRRRSGVTVRELMSALNATRVVTRYTGWMVSGVVGGRVAEIFRTRLDISSVGVRLFVGARSSCASSRECRHEACVRDCFGRRLHTNKRRCSQA
jgi:hypothetical protein